MTEDEAKVESLERELAEARRRLSLMEEDDPTEGLPGALTVIVSECANGRPIAGGDLELIEEAARRLVGLEEARDSAVRAWASYRKIASDREAALQSAQDEAATWKADSAVAHLRMREVMEAVWPLVDALAAADDNVQRDHEHIWESPLAISLTFGDFRRLASVYARVKS